MQKKPNKKLIINKKKTTADYEQQIGELTAHLQRLQAEFENYKKRERVTFLLLKRKKTM